MIKLDGSKVAKEIRDEIKAKIEKEDLKLKLVVILIGNDPASEKYVKFKGLAAEEVGMDFDLIRYDESVTQDEVLQLISKLNADESVTGMIVQLPIPEHIDVDTVLESIDPKKDADGLSSVNLGLLTKNLDGIFPATPEGVMYLIDYYKIPVQGQNITVIGQSNIVGKPLTIQLLNREATVYSANKYTKDLKKFTLDSEIIISAAGVPKLIKEDMVKEGAVVFDVGTRMVEGKLVGDVDYENVAPKCSFITPSPGGVGPMTVAMLLLNIVKAGGYYGNK